MTNMYEIRSRAQKQEYYLYFVRLVSQSLLSISLVMHWLGSDLDPGKALLSGQSGRRICIFLHTRHFGNLIKCCCYLFNLFLLSKLHEMFYLDIVAGNPNLYFVIYTCTCTLYLFRACDPCLKMIRI